jgi:hypothetical protein
MVPHHRFGSRLAIRPRNLPSNSSRLRRGYDRAPRGAVSFYNPQEMLGLAREAGVKDAQHVSGTVLAERYFANRTDGLCPSSGEDLLVATT